MNNRKAQSAMEYLMTYGWAILVVLIALGALFYLGVFNPKSGNVCQGSAPISCTDVRGTSAASGVNLEFSVGVTGAATASVPVASATSPVLFVNEVSKTCTAPASVTALSATAQTKVSFTCPTMTKDQKFRGTLPVTYTLQGSTVTHTGSVDFSGTVE